MPNTVHVNQDFARTVSESNALFMSIGDGALVTNQNGEIIRINQKALDLLRLKADEVIGQWYADVIIGEDAQGQRIPNIDRPMTEVFLTGKSVVAQIKYRRRNRSPIAVNMTVSPIVLDGQPIGAIEVFRDVTKEVALEKAKDEFIALASHQLRTPATGVKQYVGMMLQGYVGKLTAEQKKMLTRAYEANERQLTIISDLLRVARVDAGEIQINLDSIRLNYLLKEIIEDYKGELKKRGQTIAYLPKDDRVVQIDPRYMRMVFENIIDNAAKYSPEGSEIKITTELRRDNIAVLVEDQGIGIKPKDVSRIFEKFFRLTHESSTEVSGTGLGLYWVKQILDLHGGSIKVDSTPSKGTTFTVMLPL